MKTDSSETRGNEIRFSLLLGALVVAAVIGPLLEETQLGEFIQIGCLTLVFVAAVIINWRHRVRLSLFGVAATITLILHWSSLLVSNDEVSIARFAFSFLFLGFTAAMLLRSIVLNYKATPDAILGAICIYLLLGLMWSLGYSAVTYIEPNAFDIPGSVDFASAKTHPSFATLIYFSFVTMSTLGYGDISPQTDLCRTLAWTQSVTGQFYLAILVARLVSILPNKESAAAESEE